MFIFIIYVLGNDKIDDLGAMCKKYTRGNENKREDIGVLRKVIVQKDNEIHDIMEEINNFEIIRKNNEHNAQMQLSRGNHEMTLNAEITLRKDKLNTDMEQKNDLLNINIV